VEAVKMMDRIVHQTENHQTYRSIIDALQPIIENTAPHAVSAAAADVANAIDAAAVVAFTSSGTTPRRVARKRPEVPIISVSPDKSIARRLALLWGVHSIQSEDISSHREMVVKAASLSVEEGFTRPGDQVVVVAGIPFGVIIAGLANVSAAVIASKANPYATGGFAGMHGEELIKVGERGTETVLPADLTALLVGAAANAYGGGGESTTNNNTTNNIEVSASDPIELVNELKKQYGMEVFR